MTLLLVVKVDCIQHVLRLLANLPERAAERVPREVRRDGDGGRAPVGCCEMHVLRIFQRRDQRERRVNIVQVEYRLVLASLAGEVVIVHVHLSHLVNR